jgi:hypothetical protein
MFRIARQVLGFRAGRPPDVISHIHYAKPYRQPIRPHLIHSWSVLGPLADLGDRQLAGGTAFEANQLCREMSRRSSVSVTVSLSDGPSARADSYELSEDPLN